MDKHIKRNGKGSPQSFKAAALKVDPSMIAMVCHLARIAAEADYKAFLKDGAIPYIAVEQLGGPA